MAYKRYIRKNGKLYGPYLYKSVRDKKGNVRNIYVGRGSEQKRASILDIFQRALLPFTSRNGKVAALFILAFISTTLLLAGIGSAVFDRLTVQGQLRDSSNEILSGNYNFSFNIYAQATGGTSLFEQNFTDLIVDSNGIYTATLTDISLPFSQNYYLGVNVDSDGEMLPRMNITDTGTAFRSNRSEYLGANLPSYFLNTSTETQTTGGSFVVTGNFTVNTDTFVIDTSVARIGIGTSSPNASLHVNGSFLQTHMSPTAIGNITDDSKGGPAPSLNGAYDVFVSGKYAYVASWGDHALQIIDISDPSNPTAIGNITDDSVGGPAPSLAGANGVYVSGKYAYVASYSDSALQIIDISDPSNPTAIGNITDDSKGGPAPSLAGANGVYVSGKYAYVASKGDDALQIIDISDPSNPTAIGNITDDSVGGPAPSLNNARSVYVSGKYAYVASWDDDSLQIIDIGGIDAPAATIGDLAVGTLDVWENADIANDLSVGSGLVVGPGGIYSQGDVAINGSINVTSGNDVCIVGGNCLSTLSGGSGGNTTAEVRAAINGSDSWFTSIGIGTATPSQKLQVSDGSILLSDGYSIYWDSTSNGINYDTTNGFRFYNGGEIDQQFKADGEAYLGLNGNVGIGTTSPTYKLEINSTDNALNVSNFLFANSTRVGIGTANPSTALGVSGNITSSDSVIVTTGISIGGDYRTEWPTGTGNTSAEMIAATNNTAHWNASRIQGSTELCIGTDCKSSWSSVGINRTLYFNKTAETYTGELSAGGYTGYEAGDYICDSNFTGTHLCQEYEIVQTMTYKNISEIDDWDGYAWYSSGGPKYTGASPANDCNGFTDGTASYLGSFWKFNQTGGGSGAMVNCAELKSLACCKAW